MGGKDSVKMTAWIKPKMGHKQMVSRLLQVRAHVILCFRAEEKIEIGKDANGKTVIRPKQSLVGLDGWVPVSEKTLPFELTLSVLMTASAPGVPRPIKLQEQHRPMVPLDRPVTEDVGAALAAWAAGAGTPGSGGGGLTAASSAEEASLPVGGTPAPPADEFASQPQRKRLFAIRAAHDVTDSRLREILADVTGQESTAQIPSGLYDAVIAAVEAEGVPA